MRGDYLLPGIYVGVLFLLLLVGLVRRQLAQLAAAVAKIKAKRHGR